MGRAFHEELHEVGFAFLTWDEWGGVEWGGVLGQCFFLITADI